MLLTFNHKDVTIISMAIKKLPNGTYMADVRLGRKDRQRAVFKTEEDARTYERNLRQILHFPRLNQALSVGELWLEYVATLPNGLTRKDKEACWNNQLASFLVYNLFTS